MKDGKGEKEERNCVRTSTILKNPRDNTEPGKRLWLMKKQVMIATKDTNSNRGVVEEKSPPACIAPYLRVGDANDASGVNIAQTTIEVPITLDGEDFQIAVPVLYNSKSVKTGTKLRKSALQSSTASGSSNVRKRKAAPQKDES